MARRRPPILLAVLAVIFLGPACSSDGGGRGVPPAEAETDPPAATGSSADPAVGYVSELYADPALWHCRPDLDDDVCSSGLAATEVAADGTLTEQAFRPADDPDLDCFYVYPTLDYSAEPGNHPFTEENPLEPITVRGQAARFGEVCRLFVPRYRQATIGSYEQARGGDLFEVDAFATAYADVVDAFTHYLANDNDGRPLVLLGHSQGSHHLVRLLQEEVEGIDTRRELLVSALLVGPTGRVQVPEGDVVGGTFAELPLCTAADETGCVVAFDSFAAEEPPSDPPPADGLVPACVDPGGLLGGDGGLAGSYFGRTVPGVGTPFELIEGYYTAGCAASAAGLPYLEIGTDPVPGDRRDLTHVDSRVADSESLHVLDYNFTLRDLITLVDSQAAAFGA